MGGHQGLRSAEMGSLGAGLDARTLVKSAFTECV